MDRLIDLAPFSVLIRVQVQFSGTEILKARYVVLDKVVTLRT